MAVGAIIKNAGMYLKGFSKVKLNDTRGVLNDSNNFYWIKKHKLKGTDGFETIKILPKTGTEIRTVSLREPSFGDILGDFFSKPSYYKAIKEVKKTDGNVIQRVSGPLGEFFVAKYKKWMGVVGNYKVLSKKTVKDIKNEEIRELRLMAQETDKILQDFVNQFK